MYQKPEPSFELEIFLAEAGKSAQKDIVLDTHTTLCDNVATRLSSLEYLKMKEMRCASYGLQTFKNQLLENFERVQWRQSSLNADFFLPLWVLFFLRMY